jgi:hypothetical protein
MKTQVVIGTALVAGALLTTPALAARDVLAVQACADGSALWLIHAPAS